MLYAEIIIDIAHASVDRPFHYRVPDRLADRLSVGDPVKVPFGAGNHLRHGYIIGFTDKTDYDPEKIKEIAECDSAGLTAQSQLISLAAWMKETYGGTMHQALRTVLPVRQKVRPKAQKILVCNLEKEELLSAIEEAKRKNYRARARLLEGFLENRTIPMEMARMQLNISEATIKPLAAKNMILVEERRSIRGNARGDGESAPKVTLNEAQEKAVNDFRTRWDAGDRKTELLYGITGSGKTEVYMEMIDHVLSRGQEAILLIPEISLTWQTLLRFYRRFGDCIGVMNSQMSDGEKYDQWERAADGSCRVMIGPRSALFAPFPGLGLIIIDEEHENAYKSENTPRYHARETAAKRAALCGAKLVLGSATPSMESAFRASVGEYHLNVLDRRAVPESRIAETAVADMRDEMAAGNRSVFSRILRDSIRECLQRKEQVMLFINRRGYSPFISCRSCGKSIRCPHCDVSMTLHGKTRLVCHYCGREAVLPARCPSCQSPYLAGFGTGTQRLEELTAREFPEARILRMDADTTRKKGGHQEILEQFAAHGADILVGTQMIVKGHDFPDVTLVGIMAADLSLNTPDFRSAERTFQLLTQAAGRAGRGKKPGRVIIQTYQPEHYAGRFAKAQDYRGFYGQEMQFRKLAGYPPAVHMAAVWFSSEEEELAGKLAEEFAGEVTMRFPDRKELQVIGPANASVYRVNDVYRKILYFKTINYDIIRTLSELAENKAHSQEWSRAALLFDTL
ncbi:MAG: primosomal protein N' [Clostridium sp.]|nr:primosomal protein N' [Clostridium sp.]